MKLKFTFGVEFEEGVENRDWEFARRKTTCSLWFLTLSFWNPKWTPRKSKQSPIAALACGGQNPLGGAASTINAAAALSSSSSASGSLEPEHSPTSMTEKGRQEKEYWDRDQREEEKRKRERKWRTEMRER